ncbi:J domain-containing protein, partial [Salmonella enterica subsp. enterica]|nr:J domain-containing protein [Salmonella enterica subsp. enterica serovar Litchfield]
DKLGGAAPELQQQAEQKSRRINAAYDRIKSLRKR